MAGENIVSSDWDLDEYRNAWDSDEQWEMRKRFMEQFKDSIVEDELVCLAQVFTNIEFLNCRYPDDVTKRVTELSCGIFDDMRASRRERQEATIKFVKEDGNEKQSQGNKRQAKLDLPAPKRRATEFSKPTNRSNAASYFQPAAAATQDSSNSNSYGGDGGNGGGGGNKYQMQNYYTSNYKSSQRNSNQWPGSGAPSRNEPERNAARNADGSGKKQLVATTKMKDLAVLLREQMSADGGNVLEKLNCCVSKKHMTIKSDVGEKKPQKKDAAIFTCEVIVDDVWVSSGEGSNKKLAKKVAYENAIVKLLDPEMVVVKGFKSLELITSKGSGAPEPVKSTKNLIDEGKKCVIRETYQSKNESIPNDRVEPSATHLSEEMLRSAIQNFGNFILVCNNSQNSSSAFHMLNTSAAVNKVKLDCTYIAPQTPGGDCRCQISIQSVVLGDGVASTKQTAKQAAAEDALSKIRTVAFTLVVKQSVVAEEVVSKSDLNLLSKAAESNVIPETNMGNRLLRMMGWTGGGLGKKGNEGIIEPIMAAAENERRDRRGLGKERQLTDDPSFKKKMRQIVATYAQSNSEFDLVFSKDFTKDERAYLHQLSSKYNLKSHSRDKEDERFLVVSKRFNPKELVQRLLRCGGSNEKYEVIHPTFKR